MTMPETHTLNQFFHGFLQDSMARHNVTDGGFSTPILAQYRIHSTQGLVITDTMQIQGDKGVHLDSNSDDNDLREA